MVCFGFNEAKIVLNDDEYGGFHTENTGRYIVMDVSGYECRDICSLEKLKIIPYQKG